MSDDAIAKDCGSPSLRAVVELIRQNDIQWPQLLLQGTDGAGGKNPFDAQLLEAVNVGAEIELVRQNRVIPVVPREECDAPFFECADAIGVGRRPKRGIQNNLFNFCKPIHFIESAAADDPDPDITFHFQQAPAKPRVYLQGE